jgi:hypothetical protein
MGLYVRVFCKSETVPTLRAAFDFTNEFDVAFTVEDHAALDDPNWNQVDLRFAPESSWALVECDRNNDLVAAEVHEFSEAIGPAGRSKHKKTIVAHLQATRFILSCQLPTDYPDDLWSAVECLLGHVVAHCEGLLQVDNVGIFLGEKLAWKVTD